jgi:hypothetical protein
LAWPRDGVTVGGSKFFARETNRGEKAVVGGGWVVVGRPKSKEEGVWRLLY